jgi:transposase-like protein
MDGEPAEPGVDVESAHTTGRMSARNQRIEVITRGERRRRWSVEQKREIAAESLEAGISPITVARRYGISSGLLYTWRRHLLEGSLGTIGRPAAEFARVEVMARPADPAPASPAELAAPANSMNHPDGMIEIALPGGVSVRVDAQVDGGALRRVLAALVRRYRQAQMLKRQGITLDRSTLSAWVGRACWWLAPLYELVLGTVLSSDKVFADETTLPVLEPGNGRTKTGRLWCYAVDDRPWSGPTHPAAAYVYSEDRRGEHPATHLAAFRGTLQVDGYAGFGNLVDARRDASLRLAFLLGACEAAVLRVLHVQPVTARRRDQHLEAASDVSAD